jgi:dTDP-4-dehydrorhamnose 3,5-epimerase
MARLTVEATRIPDVKIIMPQKFGDDRGFFSETYNQLLFAEHGINEEFVQDNQSLSSKAGTLRGLHFQSSPFAQAKLVRVLRGAILDVAVDIRRQSATYGQHVSVELSAQNWRQLLVPVGFAHGFCTLEPDTEVAYKVTNYYASSHDKGIAYDDPDLAIDWRFERSALSLSDKDGHHPSFSELPAYF